MEHDVAVDRNADSTKPVLWMAMELSLSKWKLGFSDGSARAARFVTIEARDYAALEQQIASAKRAFKLDETSVVRSLYEAGREGFSVHRRLEQMAVENMIVDPASLEVSRHARRAKSDTLDVESLLRHLMAYGANRGRLAIVRVPKPEDEARRQLDREIEALQKERGVHTKRIQSLLFAQGIAMVVKATSLDTLETLRTADGRALPQELIARIGRERRRLELVQEQIQQLEKERETQIVHGTGKSAERMRILMSLCGIRLDGELSLGGRIFRMENVPESPASCASRRAGCEPLRERHDGSRTRHQQSRQPSRAGSDDRTRVVLAPMAARQRAGQMVRATIRRSSTCTANRHRRGRTPLTH
jgi:transposase